MTSIKPGVYEHYKGNKYEVLGDGKHTETLEDLVVYREIQSDSVDVPRMWVRPKAMFLEVVDVEGVETPRFKYVGQSR